METTINHRATSHAADRPLQSLGRFARFGLVGASGVVVNMGFYALFHNVLGVYYLLAGAMAIELSIVSNFLLNEYWTFRDRSAGNLKRLVMRSLAFNATSLMTAGMTQLLTLYVLTSYLGMWDKLAYLIGIGLGALVNYTVCNRLIFRHGSPSNDPRETGDGRPPAA
ncbi:MAG: GtrA family protein [Candidatus Zixiibacteriota bacterium]|nr:MAG: GtrA family protein [candidate division Zixibacteria bacterium]